jgi:hypothetical protein
MSDPRNRVSPIEPIPLPARRGGRGKPKLLSCVAVSRGLFSYRAFMVAQPLPSLECLPKQAEEQSALRAA